MSYRVTIRYTSGGDAGSERVETQYTDGFPAMRVESVFDGQRQGSRIFRRQSVQRDGSRIVGVTYVEDRIEWSER